MLPLFKDEGSMIAYGITDEKRQEMMREVHEIKDRLARDGCQSNLKVIQKAVIMHEEV